MQSNQSIQQKFLSAVKFHKQGSFSKAKQLYQEILRSQPNNDMVLNFLGLIALHFNEFDNALKYLSKAAAINPSAQYFKDIGDLYVKKTEPAKALEFYEKAKSIEPDNYELNHCMGLAFMDLNQYQQAEQAFLRALNGNPQCAETFYNLGTAYYQLFRYDEAISCYIRSLELNPNSAETYQALGVVLYDVNRLNDSILAYEKAVQLQPDYPDAYFGASYSYLKTMNFEKGWMYYEYRFFKTLPVALPVFKNPVWDGSNPSGKKLMVFLEQGLGDALMFSRYLPMLDALGVKILTAPHISLKKLLKDSFPFVEFYETYEDIKDTDYDCFIPAMSLPLRLKTRPDNIPSPSGYLKADPQKVEEYRQKYFDNDSYKVGIVWQCKNKYQKDKTRSVPHINCFEKLFGIEGVKFYSLQKGEAELQLGELTDSVKIQNIGKDFNDFADTAAAIENLDLVISVDTSVLHLAGGLGKDTWLMLPYDSDWKWFMDLETSPWYNSVKIFKQPEIENWQVVVDRMYDTLLTCVKEE